jgi:hypothetical protein
MKNSNLKNVLAKFNTLAVSKSDSIEVLNDTQVIGLKGGLIDACSGRFKIKCTGGFTMPPA